jgi:hypothetical protein
MISTLNFEIGFRKVANLKTNGIQKSMLENQNIVQVV